MLDEEQSLLPSNRGMGIDFLEEGRQERSWQQRPERVARDRRARRKLVLSAALCFVFMVAELLGGYITGSLAVMTDASHLLSDFAGFIISLVALQKSQKRANQMLTYGYGRAEVLGAFTSILLIWTLTAVLVVEAIRRIIHPEPVKGRLMFIIAVLGIFINLAMMTVLGHGHGHVHGHGGHEHDQHDHEHADDHGKRQSVIGAASMQSFEATEQTRSAFASAATDQPQRHDEFVAYSQSPVDIEAHAALASAGPAVSTKGTSVHTHSMSESVNVHAAYLHVLGDLIQSVGVAVAALLIWWRPQWSLADPLCTLFFSAIVLYTTLRMIGDIVQVLMEGTPAHIHTRDVYAALVSIDGVSEVQDLHIWSLSVGRAALSAKLRCDASVTDAHQITMAAEQVCAQQFGIEHVTIQVNCVNPSCCPPVAHFECASPGKG
jgi:zinc transporter 2